MTAAVRTVAASTADVEAPEYAPKHTAEKTAGRFHTAIADSKAVVTSRFTSQGRAARALGKAVEAEANAAEKAIKAAQKAQAKATKARESLTVLDGGLFTPVTLKIRSSIAVDDKGEATPVYVSVAKGLAGVAETAGETLASVYPAGDWFTTLFETQEQRRRRYNVNAVAQTLLLTAGAAARIAQLRKR